VPSSERGGGVSKVGGEGRGGGVRGGLPSPPVSRTLLNFDPKCFDVVLSIVLANGCLFASFQKSDSVSIVGAAARHDRNAVCKAQVRVKRDLLQCQKRPTTVSKETYYSVKRDLLQCQKRPTTVSKETYYSVKRDLLQCQKRPTTVSKETYYSVK
jgi:hypothetical protein